MAYVDIGFRDGKKHTVLLKYDEREEVRRINSLLDLLDLSVQMVFIDTLTFRVIPELRTLAEHGVHVYYLQNLRLLKAVRDGDGMTKSDENDARLLSLIPSNEFSPADHPLFLSLYNICAVLDNSLETVVALR